MALFGDIMKYFVTGASGMLGTTLYRLFTKAGHQVISTDLNPLDPWTIKLDVRDKDKVYSMIKENSPDWALNLAALTDLEYCEEHPQEAFDTNAMGAENVALACKDLGIKMVHISTAGVFDGESDRPYTEDDEPNPINVYGKSKHEGDKKVVSIMKAYFIFRAGWMMGSGDRDKKFVKKILKQVDSGQTIIYGLIDKLGCPTYTLDFASGILKMTNESKDYGLYHMVSEGNCSRYDVAVKIKDILQLNHVWVKEVSGDFFNESFYAPRPTCEVMENKKFHEKGIEVMRNWQEAITDYLSEYFLYKYQFKAREIFEKYEPGFGTDGKPVVSIVTTAYKNEKFNEKYFDTVNNQTYKNVEVIFVDNLSPDNTFEDSKKRLKNGKIVLSAENYGCAGGNNLGALHSTGKYIFLLGPDMWSDPKLVENLVNAAEKNSRNIYAAKQYTYDAREFISCGIASDVFGYPARTYTPDGKKQLKKVFYADGSGVFMPLEEYIKVGMMDEDTFLFAEDVDLSWKAHMVGMDVFPVPDAILYHYSGGSVGIGGYPTKDQKYVTTSKRRFMAERNIIRNILKNYSWWNILWVLPYYMLINLAEFLALTLTGQFNSAYDSYIKAYTWNIKNFKSTLRKRKGIQRVRTKGDYEVMKSMYLLPHKFLALLELGIPKVNK